jgi:hypothetical protein
MNRLPKVYLDHCAYNRPFDDKEQVTVQMEAAAKLHIQDEIRAGHYDLVWSYMNDFENSDNPFADRQAAIQEWEGIATQLCAPSDSILAQGKAFQERHIHHKDALHLACAIESGCDYFVTTDVPLLKKAARVPEIKLRNPIDFVREMEVTNGSDN